MKDLKDVKDKKAAAQFGIITVIVLAILVSVFLGRVVAYFLLFGGLTLIFAFAKKKGMPTWSLGIVTVIFFFGVLAVNLPGPCTALLKWLKSEVFAAQVAMTALNGRIDTLQHETTMTLDSLNGSDYETMKNAILDSVRSKKLTPHQGKLMIDSLADAMAFRHQSAPEKVQLVSYAVPSTAQPPLTGVSDNSLHNPLNITWGDDVQEFGGTHSGRFTTEGYELTQFPNEDQGIAAARHLLMSQTYGELTVDQAMKKWSHNGYGGEIISGTDISPDQKVFSLTDPQVNELLAVMARRESGHSTGHSTLMTGTTPASQPRLDTLVLPLGTGWTSFDLSAVAHNRVWRSASGAYQIRFRDGSTYTGPPGEDPASMGSHYPYAGEARALNAQVTLRFRYY